MTWQGVPHSLGQAPNHLSHYSDQYSSDSPESWDNRQPGWIPHHEGLPRHIGGLSIFSGGGPPYDPGGGPWLPRKRSPALSESPGGGHQSPAGPPGGGSLGPPGEWDLKAYPGSHPHGKVVLH